MVFACFRMTNLFSIILTRVEFLTFLSFHRLPTQEQMHVFNLDARGGGNDTEIPVTGPLAQGVRPLSRPRSKHLTLCVCIRMVAGALLFPRI